MVNYSCDVCNFSTTIKTHYNRHLNTKKHKKNAKPFKCPECDDCFTLKSSLDRHIEKFCDPKQKFKILLEEKEKYIKQLEKTNITQYNTAIQCNIYNMPPIKFLNKFFCNNPSFQDIISNLHQNTLTNEEIKNLENAHQTGNSAFIGYEIDKILKSRNMKLINEMETTEKTCPNFMFSNDGSCRRYIAKGPNEWEFFTDQNSLEDSTSVILDNASMESDELLNKNKRERNLIVKCIQRINDWNTSKLELLDKI